MTPLAFLPKVRSDSLRQSAKGQPCALRISSFIPGHSCSGSDTVVLCHMIGMKGIGTKVSDLDAAFGCSHCHDLLDQRDSRMSYIEEKYPLALAHRLLAARSETQSRWLEMGLIEIPGAKTI